MLFRKKRWLCKEIEDMLLALHPVYDISVRMNVSGTPVSFPFRDNDGNMIVDPYERGVISVTVDYMRGGCPVETFFVGRGIESDRIDFVREDGDDSPSIAVPFSYLSPETKRHICDIICNLDSDAVPVQLEFFLDCMNAEEICTTLDQLALHDAEKEAEQDEEGEL